MRKTAASNTIIPTTLRGSTLSATLSVALTLSPVSAHAASSHDVGPKYPYIATSHHFHFHFPEPDHIVSVKLQENRLFVQHFDTGGFGEYLREEQFIPGQPEAILRHGQGIYVFFSTASEASQRARLHVVPIDPSTGLLRPEPHLLVEVADTHPEWQLDRKGQRASVPYGWTVRGNAGKDKLLVLYRPRPVRPSSPNGSGDVEVAVFGSTLQRLWRTAAPVPSSDDEVEQWSTVLAGDGSVWTAAVKRPVGNSSPPAEDDVVVHRIDEFGPTRVATTPATKERRVRGMRLVDAGPSGVWLVGLYGDPTESDFGFCTWNVGKGADAPWNYHRLQGEIAESFSSRREYAWIRTGEGGLLPRFDLSTVSASAHGELLLIAEQRWFGHLPALASGARLSGDLGYHFGDLVVPVTDAHGTAQFMHRVPKDQYYDRLPRGPSYTFTDRANHHELLYIDHLTNQDLKADELPSEHLDGRGGYLRSYKIFHGTGRAHSRPLFNLATVSNVDAEDLELDDAVALPDGGWAIEAADDGQDGGWIRVRPWAAWRGPG